MIDAYKKGCLNELLRGNRMMPMTYGEAKAIVSLYAIFIFGIGVFTPEQ